MLEKEQLFQAGKDQAEAHQNLTKLLELLLSEDRGKRIESEKERIRNYLSRVNRIIKDQKDLQGQTPDALDPKNLATKQGGLAEKTGQLGKDMQAAAGQKLSDGKKIDNLYDFTYALRAKQPGDTVKVKVLRSGQTIEADVLLERRK
jgi:hypothetical protein